MMMMVMMQVVGCLCRLFWEDIPYGLCILKNLVEMLGNFPTPGIDFMIRWHQQFMNKVRQQHPPTHPLPRPCCHHRLPPYLPTPGLVHRRVFLPPSPSRVAEAAV